MCVLILSLQSTSSRGAFYKVSIDNINKTKGNARPRYLTSSHLRLILVFCPR